MYDSNCLRIYVFITYNIHLGGLGGHGGLQMALIISEVKFDLRFDTSNLKYPDIHVHIASGGHLGGLRGLGGLQMTSEVNLTSEVIFDNKIEVWNLKYPDIHVHIASDSHLGGL